MVLFFALLLGMQEQHLYYTRAISEVTAQSVPCVNGDCPNDSCSGFRVPWGTLAEGWAGSSCYCNTRNTWPCPGKRDALLTGGSAEFVSFLDFESFVEDSYLVGPVGSLYLDFGSDFWVFDGPSGIHNGGSIAGCCANAGTTFDMNNDSEISAALFFGKHFSVFNSIIEPGVGLVDFDVECPLLNARLGMLAGTHGWLVDVDPDLVLVVKGWKQGTTWFPYYEGEYGEYPPLTEFWFIIRQKDHCNSRQSVGINCNGMGCSPTGRGYYSYEAGTGCDGSGEEEFDFYCDVLSEGFPYVLHVRIEWQEDWTSTGTAFWETMAAELVQLQAMIAGLSFSSEYPEPDPQAFRDRATGAMDEFMTDLDFSTGKDITGVLEGDEMLHFRGPWDVAKTGLLVMNQSTPSNFRFQLPLSDFDQELDGIFFDFGDAAGTVIPMLGSWYIPLKLLVTFHMVLPVIMAQIYWVMWAMGWAQVTIGEHSMGSSVL